MSGIEFANPVPFPDPQFNNAAMRRRAVLDRGVVRQQIVLESTSGCCYEFGRILKESIYGQVNHAFLLQMGEDGNLVRTSTQIAVKVYIKSRLRDLHGRTQENPVMEIAAQQLIGQHENVVTFRECCHDADHVFGIMEFCDGGELYDVIEDNGPFSEDEARVFFKQVVQGSIHLASKGVTHRDMSLENILLSRSTGICKIIDFGMSLRLPLNPSGQILRIPPQGVCGKRNYISPEVLQNTEPFDGLLADRWALGVILFIMVAGVPPVEVALETDARYRMIGEGLLGDLLCQWGIHLSDNLTDLLQRMLRPNPTERLSFDEICSHSWMQ